MSVQLLILGAIIGFNNLATSLALGALGQADKRWRIISVFAAFEFGVPLVGLWLGRRTSEIFSDGAEFLGPALLAALGLLTLFESSRDTRDRESLARRLASWTGLFFLSAVLSLDNLVVGFSLGLGGVSPLLLATTIMLFSVVFSWIGLQVGNRSRHNYESATEVISGVLLLMLAWADWTGRL